MGGKTDFYGTVPSECQLRTVGASKSLHRDCRTGVASNWLSMSPCARFSWRTAHCRTRWTRTLFFFRCDDESQSLSPSKLASVWATRRQAWPRSSRTRVLERRTALLWRAAALAWQRRWPRLLSAACARACSRSLVALADDGAVAAVEGRTNVFSLN